MNNFEEEPTKAKSQSFEKLYTGREQPAHCRVERFAKLIDEENKFRRVSQYCSAKPAEPAPRLEGPQDEPSRERHSVGVEEIDPIAGSAVGEAEVVRLASDAMVYPTPTRFMTRTGLPLDPDKAQVGRNRQLELMDRFNVKTDITRQGQGFGNPRAMASCVEHPQARGCVVGHSTSHGSPIAGGFGGHSQSKQERLDPRR